MCDGRRRPVWTPVCPRWRDDARRDNDLRQTTTICIYSYIESAPRDWRPHTTLRNNLFCPIGRRGHSICINRWFSSPQRSSGSYIVWFILVYILRAAVCVNVCVSKIIYQSLWCLCNDLPKIAIIDAIIDGLLRMGKFHSQNIHLLYEYHTHHEAQCVCYLRAVCDRDSHRGWHLTHTIVNSRIAQTAHVHTKRKSHHGRRRYISKAMSILFSMTIRVCTLNASHDTSDECVGSFFSFFF